MLTCKKCNGTNLVMRRNAINPMHTELICEDCGVRVKFMNADEARLYETKREFNVEEFCRKVNDLGKAAINDEPPKPPIQVSMIFVRNMNCDRTTDVQLNEFLTSHPKYRVDKISFVSRAGDTCFERLFVVFSVYDI